MDMTPIKATATGLGIQSNRKYVGLLYVSYSPSSASHSRIGCPFFITQGNRERRQVYQAGGEFYFDTQDGYPIRVTLCSCVDWVPPSRDWMQDGRCIETHDTRLFHNSPKVRAIAIRELCDLCPVALDCLNYGEAQSDENVGAVWGGVYFGRDRETRGRMIEQRRKELESC